MRPTRCRGSTSTPSSASSAFSSAFALSPPSNNWTYLQKVTLVLLVEALRAPWKIIRQVFNEIFQQQIPSPFGLSENALRTYYWGLRRGVCKIYGERSILRTYAIDLLKNKLGNESFNCKAKDDSVEEPDNDGVMSTCADAQQSAQHSLPPLYSQLLTCAKSIPDLQGHPNVSTLR